MRAGYTELNCIYELEKRGCKFGGGRGFTVPSGKLGIKYLGMVDYLINNHAMIATFV